MKIIASQEVCVHRACMPPTLTTGIWNGPMVRAMPIVEVDVVSPMTACTLESLLQLPAPLSYLFIKFSDALIDKGILGQESKIL